MNHRVVRYLRSEEEVAEVVAVVAVVAVSGSMVRFLYRCYCHPIRSVARC